MIRKYVFLKSVAIIVVSIWGLNFTIRQAHATYPNVSSAIVWIDNFDSASLDSRWSWIREDPSHWNLTSMPGFLHIITQLGSVGVGNDAKNLLLTSAPHGNYRITTKVSIEPTANFQGAGIFVYQDDNNYLKVSRRFGNGQKVTFRQEINGEIYSFDDEVTASTVYLRLSRDGDAYVGMYSLDGVTWSYLGQYNQSMTNPKIGIGSENGPSEIEIASDYDFFQLDDYTNYLFLPSLFKD